MTVLFLLGRHICPPFLYDQVHPQCNWSRSFDPWPLTHVNFQASMWHRHQITILKIFFRNFIDIPRSNTIFIPSYLTFTIHLRQVNLPLFLNTAAHFQFTILELFGLLGHLGHYREAETPAILNNLTFNSCFFFFFFT